MPKRPPTYVRLERGREGLGQLAAFPLAGALERLDRARLVVMEDSVELLGEARREVVAEPLGLWLVHHADSALESRFAERRRYRTRRPEVEKEIGWPVVERRLVAAGQRGAGLAREAQRGGASARRGAEGETDRGWAGGVRRRVAAGEGGAAPSRRARRVPGGGGGHGPVAQHKSKKHQWKNIKYDLKYHY